MALAVSLSHSEDRYLPDMGYCLKEGHGVLRVDLVAPLGVKG